MFDEMDFLLSLLGGIIATAIGIAVGVTYAEPTELPNGCILHDDVIYCEVAE